MTVQFLRDYLLKLVKSISIIEIIYLFLLERNINFEDVQ